MCGTLIIAFRDRVFTPAVTLGLFVSQVLSRGDACITVMAKFNRERKDRGLPPVAEDASAYTKARARLPVMLIRRGVHMVCCINGTRNSPFEGACETIEDLIVELRKPRFNPSRFTRQEWNALPRTSRNCTV
jgi:hypothetical protein